MQRFRDPGESLKIACCSVWVYQEATVHFIREKVKPGLFLFFLSPEDLCTATEKHPLHEGSGGMGNVV